MTYSAHDFRRDLDRELDAGYDVVRIARFAFDIYQTRGRELSPKLDEKVVQVVAMEEGPEFEMTEDELRQFAMNVVDGHLLLDNVAKTFSCKSRIQSVSYHRCHLEIGV